MANKKTHEEFLKEFYEKNPDANNIEILEKYDGNKKPIKCRCKIHNIIWYPTPITLLGCKNTPPTGCPKCGREKSSNKRLNKHEEFMDKFYKKNKYAKDIIIKSEYRGANEYIDCECKLDGNKWKATAHNLLRGKGCPQCAINRRKGSKNCRYNPNITDEEREAGRNYSDYKEWRTKCFERDDYTCQVTGKKGGKLEVHHIYSYDNNKELRLDVNNGITVSKEIHKQFHSIYGYGNNTLEQWGEFIKSLK